MNSKIYFFGTFFVVFMLGLAASAQPSLFPVRFNSDCHDFVETESTVTTSIGTFTVVNGSCVVTPDRTFGARAYKLDTKKADPNGKFLFLGEVNGKVVLVTESGVWEYHRVEAGVFTMETFVKTLDPPVGEKVVSAKVEANNLKLKMGSMLPTEVQKMFAHDFTSCTRTMACSTCGCRN